MTIAELQQLAQREVQRAESAAFFRCVTRAHDDLIGRRAYERREGRA